MGLDCHEQLRIIRFLRYEVFDCLININILALEIKCCGVL